VKEATLLVQHYFNNGEFITQVKAQYPAEILILQKQKKLA
jgi:hypothetical protein